MPPFEQLEPILLMHHKWATTPHVPLYLFFGGLAAGIFIVAAIADLFSLKSPRFEAVAKAAGYLAFPTAAIAGIFLTLHLGKPERGILFPIFFTNYNSWMVIGGWILTAFLTLSGAYLAILYFGIDRRARIVVDLVGIPVALGVAAYTGFLLSGPGFIPLWNQQHLPLMFVNSGITTGIALAGVATLIATKIHWPWGGPVRLEERDQGSVIRWLTLFMGIAILAESYEMYSLLAHLTGKDPAKGGELVVHMLTKGSLAPWFWWGFVGLGLGLPLVLGLMQFFIRRPIPALAYTYFGLALLGGLLLRFIIVWGGELKQPLPFPPSKWPFNLY